MTIYGEKRSLSHTYKTQSFAGVIEWDKTKGRKHLVIPAEKYFRTQLNKFDVGTKVSLYVTDKKPKRTEQQNRYYRVYLQAISDHTGEDPDDLHELFKGEFLTLKIIKVLGKPVRVKRSSTELSVLEFSEFIRNIEVLTGVLAPPIETD